MDAGRKLFRSIYCFSSRLHRRFSSTAFNQDALPKMSLWDEYQKTKQKVQDIPIAPSIDDTAVFANNELDLTNVDVYGFDYDYTLASYTKALHHLIYSLGQYALVNNHKYPSKILQFKYDDSFSIRGLHCDVRKGTLLKIDAFHNIQMGTVYRGLTPLSDDEVLQLYHGRHVAIDHMSSFHGKGSSMHQLMDLFALPEMTLFANIIQYFLDNGIPYDPEYVFYDVKEAVQGIHKSGLLHNEVLLNKEQFLQKGPEVEYLLRSLSAAGKKLFLITNSGVNFVAQGMSYIVGPEWYNLFDVIITNARKPKFFYEEGRPFRKFNMELDVKSWDRVHVFKKGEFYQEGNLYNFQKLTGWHGGRVLYFGDHVYSDLADAALMHGWRTAAIIPELESEIKIENSDSYKHAIQWLISLESLIQRMQVYSDADSQKALNLWIVERNKLRKFTKSVFNKQFGSVFRTFHNPTYFTRRMNRFADVYMSSVTNLSSYPLDYTFYPRRVALPHQNAFSVVDSSAP